MTARDVLDLIKKNLGSPWNENTYRDVFHAGDPNVQVKGIATCFMATLDLLQRAHAAGMNLIVTHETTFWSDRDDTKDLAGDAVYRFKVDFCAKNQMVVLRLHDHAHSHQPDFILTGLLRALGWTADANQPNPRVYRFPTTTLGELASGIQRRTNSKAFRVVGDPMAKVSTGTAGMGYSTGRFSPDVDVVVIGENPETGNAFDATEYALDAAFLGKTLPGMNKGQIILGHAISEEPGMEDVANWLRTFLKDVPVQFIRSGRTLLVARPARLALPFRVVLEALLERHAKRDRHFERSLKRRRILVLFDGDYGLPCDADFIGKLLLRHLARAPEFSNLIAYSRHQSAFRYAIICVAVFVISATTNMPKKTLKK